LPEPKIRLDVFHSSTRVLKKTIPLGGRIEEYR
jgi:hypothetical protein